MRESSIRVAAALVASAVIVCTGARPSLSADAPSTMTKVGSAAPAVVGQSVSDGKIESYDLAKTLGKGAIVLYFFPKAFSGG